MADIYRTRVYAVLKGMELVDGDFMGTEHVIDGRCGSLDAYAVKAKRLWPNFVARSIEVWSQRVVMSEQDFYAHATFESPQPWNPDEHKRHAEVEKTEA